MTVSAQGPVVLDDSSLIIQAALNGAGLGMALENAVAQPIANRRLIQVLADWCPLFPGFYLYYPSRRHQPASLTALIKTLRLSAESMPVANSVRRPQ